MASHRGRMVVAHGQRQFAGDVPHIRPSRLMAMASTPEAVVLLFIVLAYLVPAVAGFPTWPGSPHASRLTAHAHADDMVTFASGYRPLRQFIWHELSEGRLPLWTPNAVLGVPLLEQYEYQLLNPLEWLNWLGGDIWWTVVLCGYLYAGALGMLAFCKRLRVDRWAALGAACAYTLAGYAPFFFVTSSFVTAVPIIPWLFWSLTRFFTEPISARSFIAFWVSAALMLLCGQPQITFCVAYFSVPFALALSIAALYGGRSFGQVAAGWGLIAMGALLAVLLASPQIVPFAKFVLSADALSDHGALRYGESGGWHVSMMNLFNPIFPYSFGVSPYDVWTENIILRPQASEDFPIGFYATGCFLAFVGAARAVRSNRERGIRVALLAAAVFLVLTIVSQASFSRHSLWQFGFVNLARYSAPVLAFFGAALISLGLNAAPLGARREVIGAAIAIAAAGAFVVLRLVTTLHQGEVISRQVLAHVLLLNAASLLAAGTMMYLFTSHRVSHAQALPAILAIFLADVFFQFRYGFSAAVDAIRIVPSALVVAAALASARRGGMLVPAAAFGVCTVLLGWAYHAGVETFRVENPHAADLARLSSILAGHRILSSAPDLYPNSAAALGLEVMSSRHPIAIRSVQSLFKVPFPGFSVRNFGGIIDGPPSGPPGQNLSWDDYCRGRSYFNALSVDILVEPVSGRLSEALSRSPACADGIEKIEDPALTYFRIYRDTHAAPRAYSTSACERIEKDAEAGRQAVQARIASVSQRPIVEGLPPSAACRSEGDGVPVPLAVHVTSPQEISVDLQGTGPSLVVLNDQFYSSWAAYVDGRRTPIYRVNSLARGVEIPAGASTLQFRYEPRLWRWWALSALAVILALGTAQLLRVRDRKV